MNSFSFDLSITSVIDSKCGELTLVLMLDFNDSMFLLILSIVLLVFLTLLLRILWCVLQRILQSFNCLKLFEVKFNTFWNYIFLETS